MGGVRGPRYTKENRFVSQKIKKSKFRLRTLLSLCPGPACSSSMYLSAVNLCKKPDACFQKMKLMHRQEREAAFPGVTGALRQ